MAAKDQIDQDALAAEWGVALNAEQQAAADNAPAAEQPEGDAEAMAAHWATMVDDGQFIQAAKGGAERILTQEEIDSLLGFSLADVNLNDNSGIRAIIDSAMVSYERLPMLEIIFDRLVRVMTTSLRNFTSDNVEVSLDRITSVRFGDYLNSIPLPAILGVFKAEEWDNSGLLTVNSKLIYSIIDVLLGGRRGQTAIRIEGRPYTTIETNLIKRMIEVLLADAKLAFRPLSPVKFNIDRRATNPRLAARHHRIAVALRHHRTDPRRAVADVHGRKVRPRLDLGRPSGDRNRPGANRRRRRALRGAVAAQADHEAQCRRHADAGNEIRRHGHRALRRGDADRRPHGPGRRPGRRARRQAFTQTEHHLRHVRNGGRHRKPHGGAIVSNGIGIMIEGLVAILLMLTVGYCMLLNRRLKLLKADEHSLRATISELVTATEIAERAIAGLKVTVHECDIGLGQRLNRAEAMTIDLVRRFPAGKNVLHRLPQIVIAGRPPQEPAAPNNDAKAVAAQAQAFAERLRTKVDRK